MPRPPKFDRVKKLIMYETGLMPVHIHETKLTMKIYFTETDLQEKSPEEIEKVLYTCIPKDKIIILSEELLENE